LDFLSWYYSCALESELMLVEYIESHCCLVLLGLLVYLQTFLYLDRFSVLVHQVIGQSVQAIETLE